MESNELRNQLLSELIGKMQDRLANKAYPDEKKEEPVVAVVEETTAPAAEAVPADDDMSDEDVEALMKAAE